MVIYASEDLDSESDKENDNPQMQILVGDVKEHVNVEYQPDNKDEMGTIEETKPCKKSMRPHTPYICSYRKPEILVLTSSPVEALSTFIRASRDPKEEQQLWVAKSIS